MLPSLYLPGDKAKPWSVLRAAGLGGALGLVAALIKTMTPIGGGWHPNFVTSLPEVACAALGFALLCAAAAALRNFIAQRLIWPGN